MDIRTHTLELIHFHLEFTLTVLEMNLLFPAVDPPIHHHVVVMMLSEYTVEEVLSQVQVATYHNGLYI